MTELTLNSRLKAEECMPPTVLSAESKDASSAQPPTKLDHDAFELYTEVRRLITRRTGLSDDDGELVAFWVLSTWFQRVLQVFPLLAISGPAHEAIRLLHVLHGLCDSPILLASFKKADLKDLGGYTLLISEPHLDNRTAALLGNLTHRFFSRRGAFILSERGFESDLPWRGFRDQENPELHSYSCSRDGFT
jgi:hypothetical protein